MGVLIKMKKILIIGILLVISLFILSGCVEDNHTESSDNNLELTDGHDDSENNNDLEDNNDAEEHSDLENSKLMDDSNALDDLDGVELSGDFKEFEIIAQNWQFIPDTIEVNLGDKVELHIESVDVTHGFKLKDFGVDLTLKPHNDVHVDFIADKKGTFPFFCSVPCGSGHGGMSGQLIVK